MRRLRGSGERHPPVVIFTADLSARKDAPGEWKDYEHFLTKPFEPDQLLEAVNGAMYSD
jgi:CheY-like chemotaxis protein